MAIKELHNYAKAQEKFQYYFTTSRYINEFLLKVIIRPSIKLLFSVYHSFMTLLCESVLSIYSISCIPQSGYFVTTIITIKPPNDSECAQCRSQPILFNFNFTKCPNLNYEIARKSKKLESVTSI